MPKKRLKMISAHRALAFFFLPLVFLYSWTGLGALLGYDEPQPFLVKPIFLNWEALPAAKGAAIEAFLDGHQLKRPAGQIRYYNSQIIWGDTIGYHLKIFYEVESRVGLLKAYEPNLYYKLLVLHKNRGQTPFKWLSFVFIAACLCLYISGLAHLARRPKSRRPSLLCLAAGFLQLLLALFMGGV